ncbi:hypothetical protein MLD38_040366 [Melastoma candidum]|uniref:Uncharacterized protein n=1 Tax=Melastoma candidum TaxID=119954 RepID=A0ACB9L555_9MYRT|nr:hypothetical protein MLD38_040366 [Melastoma candidum]
MVTTNDEAVSTVWNIHHSPRKRPRVPRFAADPFDALPDDLVLSILSRLASSASRPADFISVISTCKRLKRLAVSSTVLSTVSLKVFAIRASNWSDEAHHFFKLCADAGNMDACYTLGMIRFYCLENRGGGTSLMAKAAMASHSAALYSLAIIQFNGSGGSNSDKDLRAGVALCARAAFLGHVDAMREVGHCLQDGYGVRKNIMEGRRFLIQANARELATALISARELSPHGCQIRDSTIVGGCPLLSYFGCNVPVPESHPANQFLVEWFGSRRVGAPGLRLCWHGGCGRLETRIQEFRKCSVCRAANYCSRACQAVDWKLRHKAECIPVGLWVEEDGDDRVRAEAGGNVVMVDS